jgi:opacity protein-like surface antigen
MKKAAVVIFILAFAAFGGVQAQSFKLALGGGLTVVDGNKTFNDLDMSTGVNTGFKIKAKIPSSSFKIIGEFRYHYFGSSSEYASSEGTIIKTFYSSSLIAIGAGTEYNFLPGDFSPYVAADIYYASSGDLEAETDGVNTKLAEGTSRMGMGLGAGLEFKLLPAMDVDFSAKYNYYNLSEKPDDADTFNGIAITLNFMFGL